MNTREVMGISPVIPVVVVDDASDAVPLARALHEGGVDVIELTLRSEAALAAIEAIATEVPEIVIGAGTVLTRRDAEKSIDAGARFLVSPGAPTDLLDAAHGWSIPWLPGVSTATEAMNVSNAGHTELKFFPASTSGGAAALGALSGPLPHLTFCPTGGISSSNATEFLRLPNVACVGGSWLTPRNLVQAKEWAAVSELARAAAGLRSSVRQHC
ncbi:bifunctional 4-hydroxy-2-oxoglutarate aldolase/2-dehydro-3-deoxy-phosphogluconate aldolase [Rhodococcus sp. 14-2470-1a]|uniref:bifunctional 4-hydroxy-2-oxoglutarate aldolase/2-dehydro-3-deoxy-phosphogluconate aldolase n=1 Tax=Rhodococcus sp. 14-2470-1a TaxID=2023150 RepID=UPI000B9BCC55|nr:bifunctional 4-hydroxy-2-oxoglutarate aldolase/2-dehydro-3-deoxy-phosphogluconate aldolase [Rhodococcus sp. 14-2470-1a]OZF55348.1 keto-deoxy-phosphogluconate aldolase [Rhodococcus sp. 14-2470-1a]